MDRAIGLWKWFPRQIRADLRQYYHLDIRQWHRGEMDSAELIDLVDGLPEASRYKGALRGYPYGVGYEWSPEEYRQAAVARQMAPLDDNGDMSVPRKLYEAYFSPVERLVMEARQKAAAVNIAGAKRVMNSGLYRNVKGGDS